MSDRRLQVFHTVAKMLSFTKAAEVLQMTQPAVTFQIRQLEEQLNVRLFDRSHNRIDLTQAGRTAYEYAQKIFDLYAEMESSIQEVTGNVTGLLRVGASTATAQYVLPAILSAFQEAFPDVHIQLKVAPTSNVLTMIENSLVDVGVIEVDAELKKFSVTLFHEQQLVVCVPPNHRLAGQQAIAVADLLHEPWILREDGSSTREAITDYFVRQGLAADKLDLAMELGSPEAIKAAVEAGRGITILPRGSVAKELKLGTIACINLNPTLARSTAFVMKPQKFPLKAVAELIGFAKKSTPNVLPPAVTALPD